MEQRFLTVTALTKYIKRKFDADPHLQDVFVKGEISNYKQHSSGHMYFTLKDERARILAVMFSSANKKLKYSPENGMKVLLRGSVSVFESSGQYQIYVKEMQPDGIGDLYLAFEQLKEKLAKEGLFASDNKKNLPQFPNTIGVVTSPTGAAIRDILTTIKRRYPIGNVLIFPALVQGEQAAPSIVSAIKQANDTKNQVDVLIIGRGGGSIEELWAFNEEMVARAIYESEVPIISAVGHETDFTIADFVADLRAPTPTGAAELAVPHVDEWAERVLTRQTRLIRAIKEKISLQSSKLERMERSYAFRYPHRLYEQKLEELDKRTEQLFTNSQKLFTVKEAQLELIEKRLARNHPDAKLQEATVHYEKSLKSLTKAMMSVLAKKEADFSNRLSTLEALSPLKIMERGYSLTYNNEGQLLKSSRNVQIKDTVRIKLSDGALMCQVTDKEE
ncbi:exodeoxyribonuclease VII large subunit [Bacillus tuaregi]|uniref:exodeoxyribonuclease VII large subunit n=1 Tax=Bacillus tuaregi TaxID=1816695 RepID=UPI0008F93736|nr:exodeoxyribonuclease VII large subunit [Bacillus tuaregi]